MRTLFVADRPGRSARRPRGLLPLVHRARTAGSLLAGLAGLTGLAGLAGHAQAAPNIVVILTDDQDSSTLAHMPKTLDRLAAQGTSFTNYLISNPTCAPSRATLLTGQYAHNHGVLNNDPPYGGYDKLDATNTLPVWLQSAGYYTVHLGKYINGSAQNAATVVPPGWSEYHGFSTKYYQYSINQDGTLGFFGNTAEDYQTDVLAARAVAALRQRAQSPAPFFMQITPFAPHDEGTSGAPIPAPRHAGQFAGQAVPRSPSHNEADVSDKPKPIRNLASLAAAEEAAIDTRYRARLETLQSVDDLVESVVSTLESEGLLGNTLVVFASDNGHFHGEHRIVSGKFRLYNEAVRVPLLIRGTGFPAGTSTSMPVSNVDLATTLVRVAGATPLRVLDGQSLRSLVANPQTAAGRVVLLENFNPTTGQPSTAIQTERYVYSLWSTSEAELYDLSVDPNQTESRHNDSRYTQIRTALDNKLRALRTCSGATCLIRYP